MKLTQTVSCGGCASKLNAVDLREILSKLPVPNSKNLLVGYQTGDDACIYKINEETALVFTTDFIAPVVDDPFDFGRVAAANALSDVYAMGGTPLVALNIVCFDETLGNSVLEQILLGASAICDDASTLLCGGHTVRSPEIRFGLAVVGTVHPERVIRNSSGKPGDILLITKPLGTGILSQALKNNLLDVELTSILTAQLCTLNDRAKDAMQAVGVRCATDITGFGLAGHLYNLARYSGCGAEIVLDDIPILPRALEFASDNIHSGIVKSNRDFVGEFLTGAKASDPKSKILFDPQTSGGMLIAVNINDLPTLIGELNKQGVVGITIGHLTEATAGTLNIL